VVRGTRLALAPQGFAPRPAPIEVELLAPVVARAGEPDEASAELRQRARSAILDRLEEPDLAAA
jgi:hypothetical protein